MIKLTSKFFSIICGFFALCICFVSCDNLFGNKIQPVQEKAYITITTNLSQNTRTVLPTGFNESTTGLKWELSGIKEGNTDQEPLGTWVDEIGVTESSTITAYQKMTSNDTSISLSAGTWAFTLTATNDSGKKLLEAELSRQEITAGTNKLEFTMKEATGDNVAGGQIEFTLNFPENIIQKVMATLTKMDDLDFTKETVFQSDATDGIGYLSQVIYNYSDSELQAGNYLLKLELQQQNGITLEDKTPIYTTINTYTCLIHVAPGLCSNGYYTLETLAQLYEITYELNNGTFDENTTITTSYNAYTSFELPIPERTGYNFLGWYTDGGCSTKVESPYNISADTTLYAKWEEKETVSAESFVLEKQDEFTNIVGLEEGESSSLVDKEYTEIKINRTDVINAWTYYVYPENNQKFKEEGNYIVSVELWAETDTVIAISAARSDMFFTVKGNSSDEDNWTECVFETGLIKDYENAEISFGVGMSTKTRIRNLIVTKIENDGLPSLAFNITKQGIENYLNQENRPDKILEVEKTDDSTGYSITINTPVSHSAKDESGSTIIVQDVTLQLRDYSTLGKINNVSFSFTSTDENLKNSVMATSVENCDDEASYEKKYDKNGIIHSWGADKIPYTSSYNVCFPSFRNNQITADNKVPCIIEGILKESTTDSITITIENFKILPISSLENTGKVFAFQIDNKWQKKYNLNDNFTVTSSYPDMIVLTDEKDMNNNNWETICWGGDNKDGFGIPNSYYCQFISVTNEIINQDLPINIKISLTDDFTVQIEEVESDSGETSGGTGNDTGTGDSSNNANTGTDKESLNSIIANPGDLTWSTVNGINSITVNNENGLLNVVDYINSNKSLNIQCSSGTEGGEWTQSISTGQTINIFLNSDISVENWIPIGTSNKPFTGSFDGQGHTITINSLDESNSGDYAGVFGNVGNGSNTTAIISNLVVKGSDEGINTSALYVGGIVAYCNGATITNCVNFADLETTSNETVYAGGIVGANVHGSTSISNCVNIGRIQSNSPDTSDSYISGIVGYVENWQQQPFSISDCLNLGEIAGRSTISGILYAKKATDNTYVTPSVSSCINVGSMTGTSVYAIANEGIESNCYYREGITTSNLLDNSEAVISKTTAELTTENALDGFSTDNWSFDTNRYPLPDLSNVFTQADESDSTIWNEIVTAAKTSGTN